MNVLKKVPFNWIAIKTIFLVVVGLALSNSAFSQIGGNNGGCDFKVTYEIEKNRNEGDFTISLNIENGFGNAEIKLVDFKDASKGIMERKSINLQDYSRGFVPTFLNLKPSTYIVQIYVTGKCMLSVNGMEGIEIKDN